MLTTRKPAGVGEILTEEFLAPMGLTQGQLAKAMGARVMQQYAVLGTYDFVNILEAPDNETIARISVELGARGTVSLTTLPALPVDAFTQMLRGK